MSFERYAVAATEALHPACPHLQAMSGVFSIASHSTLQYFPDVTVQEQTGCAHFLLSAMFLSPSSSRQARLLLHRTPAFVGHQVNEV